MYEIIRSKGQEIQLGENIVVTLVDVRGDKVRIGIEGPQEMTVHRGEVYDVIIQALRPKGPKVNFKITSDGPNRLGLVEVCQRFVDEQSAAGRLDHEQAAETVLEQFRRAVAAELKSLDARATDAAPERLT